MKELVEHTNEERVKSIKSAKDALYVLNGKWKLVVMALSSGAKRFKEIQRSIPSIAPRVLSKELRELELNRFVERDIDDGMQLQITYRMMAQ